VRYQAALRPVSAPEQALAPGRSALMAGRASFVNAFHTKGVGGVTVCIH